MSRIRKNYENSFAHRFLVFVKGDKPLPEEDHVEEWKHRVAEVKETERAENASYLELAETDPYEDAKRFAKMSDMRVFRRIYYVLAMLMCLMIIGMLIMNVAYMPVFGSEDTPTNNEVAERYLEKGSEETGVVNTVTGMILQYRAFDTFGETNVLFVAACSVMILLFYKTEPETDGTEKRRRKKKAVTRHNDEAVAQAEAAAETPEGSVTAPSCVWPQGMQEKETEPERDIILQNVARVVVPMIFLFGLYILVAVINLVGVIIGAVFSGVFSVIGSALSGGGVTLGIALGVAWYFLRRRNAAGADESAASVDGETVEAYVKED